ncbi:MAG: cytochrome c [Bryobacter sp.]|nr:cytochrome c [Bryobacter sp.]
MSDIPQPLPGANLPSGKRPPEAEDRILEMHAAAMREMTEPRDGVHPTPVTYIIMALFFAMWGGWYIGSYAGDWTANGLAETASKMGVPVATPQNPMELGAEVYNACMQCHQADGKGVSGSFPPLANSDYVTGDPKRLAAILINGLQGDLTVNGQVYNSQMPAWKDNYNDEEIAAVMTYIRNSFGNKAGNVDKSVVEGVRKVTAAQGPWTEASLAEFVKAQ